MRRAAAVVLAFAISGVTPLSGKGLTSRIRIRDLERRSTVEIVNPAVLDRFDVWSGRGVFIGDVEETDGFIIDWASGVISERPRGLRRYEIAFYVAPQQSGNDELAYVVLYEHDAVHGGFVYLPGRADPQYGVNVKTMLRGDGLEGHWFRATAEWQRAFGTLMP